VKALAVIGHLSRDTIEGGAPRIGGGPYYAARALRALGRPARVIARCGAADRATFLPQVAAMGLPVTLVESAETAAFAIEYDGDRRTMRVDGVGDPWRPEDLAGVRADCVHLAALLRSDFPPETLAAVARGRRVLLDAQGLVRRPDHGPLRLDADFDVDLLRHVSILKLSDEEAEVLGDPAALGVPEVVVTYGSRGSAVIAGGTRTEVPAHPLRADPTGAGDGFAAVYLASRCDGHAPAAAARRATAVVTGLMR
jgi:sugar/nucleoside kinase (ribokinase family)